MIAESVMEPLGSLSILLTSGCNLDCSYCYRQGVSARSLEWADLRRTLDWALPAPGGPLELVFSGGEPLLEFGLLQRAVSHVRNSTLAARPVTFRVLTNGLLLDDEKIHFLADNRVRLNLSFDGVRTAQDSRGVGTWAVLDELLDDLPNLRPAWYEECCQVTLTLTPGNLTCLSSSVSYLLGKGVPRIGISPALTRVPGWDDDLRTDLDHQFASVMSLSLDVFRATGRMPFIPFRKYPEADSEAPTGRRICSALRARHPVLDVDGKLYSCLMFAPSGLDPSDARMTEISRDIAFGRAGQPGCEAVRRSFPAAMKNSGLFVSEGNLGSRFGKCCDCREAATCLVCPLARLAFGPGPNPDRIPAFLCAYHLVKAKYRRLAPVLEDPNPPRVTAESINERMKYWASRHEKSPETAVPGD